MALAEAGIRSRIITRDLPEQTTSIVAAAVWYPYETAPLDRVPAWNKRSLEVFHELIDVPEAGVAVTRVTELFTHPIAEQPWAGWVRRFRTLTEPELPSGYAAGFAFDTVRIDPPIYLSYLMRRFERAGGSVDHRPEGVGRLEDVTSGDATIVNCSGLGARELVGDATVYPIRGQVVSVENPGISTSLIDESDPERIRYMFPRSNELVLGGTREIGEDDLTPNDATTERILADISELEPRLSNPSIRAVRVGLRPGRDAVRVELETTERGRVVHNYGHAGNGYGLSWGCAEAVRDLVIGCA